MKVNNIRSDPTGNSAKNNSLMPYVSFYNTTASTWTLAYAKTTWESSAVISSAMILKTPSPRAVRFFQSQIIFSFGCFDPISIVLIIQINNFQGNLADISVKQRFTGCRL